MMAVGSTLISESALGFKEGHQEITVFMEKLLKRLQEGVQERPSPRRSGRAAPKNAPVEPLK
jgi:hypothetical protein